MIITWKLISLGKPHLQFSLFSSPKCQGDISLKEELFVFLGHHDRDFAGIELSADADFNTGNQFVEASVIKTQGSFHKRTWFDADFVPALSKS